MSPAASSLILLLEMLSSCSFEMFFRALEIFMMPTVWKLFSLRSSSCRIVLWDKAVAMSSAASALILLLEKLIILSLVNLCKLLAILIALIPCKLLSLSFNSLNSWQSCKTAAIFAAAVSSILILLFETSIFVRVRVLGLFSKAFAILMMPVAFKLLPLKFSFCSLLLCDNTVAMSSAASSLALLPAISNSVRVEVLHKPFAIFIAPAACKLFPPRCNPCSFVLLHKTFAMSSAPSLLMLLSEIPNVVKVKVFCKPFATFMAPIVWKLFLPNLSISNFVLWYKTLAMSSAASLPILLSSSVIDFNVGMFLKPCAILIAPADWRQLLLKHNLSRLLL